MHKSHLLLSVLALLTLAGLPLHARQPNILWLVAEDFSPDLGCYGEKLVQSPNIDKLAAEGVRFTRAFTTAPVCSASRSAFMTGMYQTTLGAHHHRSHRDDGFTLPEGVKVLPDWMREAGYYTANVRKLPANCDFKGSGKTDWNFTRNGGSANSPPFDTADWADLKSHQPFIAQINFQETHRGFKGKEVVDPAKVTVPPIYPEHPVTRQDWARYLDAAMELDRKVGLILDALAADGLADDTIVLFTSDHGQAHVRGKQFCYDDGLRIPMVLKWANNHTPPSQYKAGSVNDQLIEAIDITPSLLAMAGKEKPAKMQGRVLWGEHAEPARTMVFGARDRCDTTVFRFRTVRDARYRYIRNFTPEKPFLQQSAYKEKQYPVWNLIKELGAEGKLTPWQQSFYLSPTMPDEELYDMETDPWSMNNLVKSTQPEHQATLNRLRADLEKWIVDSDDQGRIPEPEEVAARGGLTKEAAGANPNKVND